MSTSNGIITAPVSIKDVQQTIGNASGDLGTLCKSSTINKWSKHKPISSSILFDTSDSFFKVNNYGLSIPIFYNPGNLSTGNTLVYYLANNDIVWPYNKPTGGSNSPYRLGDFLNYYHGALNPIGSIGATDFYYNGNAVVINYEEITDVTDVGNQYNIMLNDLQINGVDISTFYYGLMLYTSSEYHLYTTNATIGNGPISFNITDIKPSTAKSYTAALFISSVMITGTAQSATYIPYEHDKDLIVIHPLKDLFSIDGSGEFTDTSNIDAMITITNNKNISMTVTGIRYFILRSRGPKPSEGEVIASGTIGNQTVEAKSKLDISFTMQCGYVAGYNYFFECQASGFETTYGGVAPLPDEVMP